MFSTWNEFLEDYFKTEEGISLRKKIDEAYASDICYPPKEMIFRAFEATPLNEVKALILGQDPYHNAGQAMGLSFSVPEGKKLPPSLENIYAEIENEEFGLMDYQSGDLTYLTKQGVMLLNCYLSVKADTPMSHRFPEYASLTRKVFELLSAQDRPTVYLLWGTFAKNHARFATNPKHLVLTANHPSPLSANRGGWFGSGVFKATNAYLSANGIAPIDWNNH